MKQFLIIVILVLFAGCLCGQTCLNPGQTPSSAIRICSNDPFSQPFVPFCGQSVLPVPCTDGFLYLNRNPFWFRINCYSSGSLGFVITPGDASMNFDWQLFDITNRSDDDVFTDPSLFVACNWSGDPGPTGASIDGTELVVCGDVGLPTFSSMPDVSGGGEYLLLVSSHDARPGGFQLVIDGGTAIIANPNAPGLLRARQSCDGLSIILQLNREVRCSSIATDGTDFNLSGGYRITSARSLLCSTNTTTDSLVLGLSSPLAIGNYVLTSRRGSDGNTLIDGCNSQLPEGETIGFTVAALQPTRMDSIKPMGCAPKYIDLVFKRPILCNSIAVDGSDFPITGPQPVLTSFNPGDCGAGSKTSVIRLNFITPILTDGTYQVQLANGSDGNSIVDECGLMTPPGSALSFVVKEPVTALFTYSMPQSCRETPVSFFHDGAGSASTWNWNFGNGATSGLQNPVYVFKTPGDHKVRLIVSNGSCTDTVSQTITTPGYLTAAFEAPAIVCPGDTVHFVNSSKGNIDSWHWSFGDGFYDGQKTPAGHRYTGTGKQMYYTVTLVATNSSSHCGDSSSRVIKVLGSCTIAVPSAFTPNGDGINDYLYPLNAVKADQLHFRVFNRFGQLVFETRDWTRKWDGTSRGAAQGTGIYVWLLYYTDHDTGSKVFQQGTTLLLR